MYRAFASNVFSFSFSFQDNIHDLSDYNVFSDQGRKRDSIEKKVSRLVENQPVHWNFCSIIIINRICTD